MVSLKNKFGVCFFISALVLVCLLMPAELKASIPCCKNGKLSSCPDLPNGQQYDISGCMNVNPVDPVIPVNPGEKYEGGVLVNDCISGQTQYKASGSCGTSSRKCCSNGTWSGWDAECSGANSCGTNQCWNGSTCVSKGETSRSCVGNILNTTGGSQTRTATCSSGSGWTYGAWTGTCTCTTGYTWNSSTKRCIKACDTSAAEWCNNCGLTFNANTCRCLCPAGSSWNGKWCVTTAGLIYSCR